MNYSRLSYTMPPDPKYGYSSDVILHKCEFCSRTFIPDSLMKHRKVCYREYLKKRSKISNLTSRNMIRSSSAQSSYKMPLGINLTALMLSRQNRRNNWRDRHEEFIQTIRSARDYSVAMSNGIVTQPPPNSMEHKENMKQCKYCLRKFHKDSILKHLSMCKEHSIRSSRSRPNEAHIQAKRRLSLRLYYKPRSFRGDSPDDQTTSISSRDLDCASNATFDSRNMNTEMSHASVISTRSPVNQRIRTASAVTISESVPKKDISTVSKKDKQRSRNDCRNNSLHRKSTNDNTEKSLRRTLSKNKKPDKLPIVRSKSIVSNKGSEKSAIGKTSDVSKTKECRRKSIAQKLKTISGLLSNNEQENNASIVSDLDRKVTVPNSSESFHKAKEILQYLSTRVKENELMNDTREFLNGTTSLDNKDSNQFEIDDRFGSDLNEVGDSKWESFINVNNTSLRPASDVVIKHEPNIVLGNENDQMDISELLSGIMDIKENNTVTTPALNQMNHNSNTNQYVNNNEQREPRILTDSVIRQHIHVHGDSEYVRMWQK